MNELVRLHSLGKKTTPLSVDRETIRFGQQAIPLDQVTGILYWISAIQFYRFPVGCSYHIGLQSPAGQVNMHFKSMLGLQQDYFGELFGSILDALWEPVTNRIWDHSRESLAAGGTLTFGHCQLSKAGIRITKDLAFTQKQAAIGWQALHYEKKHDRLVLNSKTEPGVWTNLYFRDTWNIDILMALLDWLTQEGGLAELQA